MAADKKSWLVGLNLECSSNSRIGVRPCAGWGGVQVPIYDFKESRRVGYRTVEVPQSRVVILEGIYALNARLRPQVRARAAA